MDWHRAACREEDPELFFPIGNTTPAIMQADEAKMVCFRCPVIEPCRQWAMNNAEHGVWGGLSESERDAARRRAARRRADAARRS
ncbi:WhiB family transcriptional regulator [Streptomyces cacaoi]|uniref:WhiB family transcriptional regulator n=1 Tax=Streptomyces cacaoi TaxID=1898 RepID=UPI0011F24954|nr:WhiB family transcriptional regulator [Streptomyces cacaoi]